ncbi:MAG: hypothetical protein AAGF31_11735, partial [Planctomycetota bacterium]
RWRLAETATALIGETGGLLTRTLVVVDKSTGRVTHAATRSRLSTQWRVLSDAERKLRVG